MALLSLCVESSCSFALDGSDQGIQFSQDGKRILTGGGGGFIVFSAESGKRLFRHDFRREPYFVTGSATTINFDGTIVAAAIAYGVDAVNHRIELFDIDKGKRIGAIVSPNPEVSFSKDGKWALGKIAGGSVVWSAANLPDLEPVISHRNAKSMPVISPDSSMVAISVGSGGLKDSGIKIHVLDVENDFETFRVFETPFKKPICCCFSPDSTSLMVTDRSSEIRVYSLRDAKLPIAFLKLSARIKNVEFIRNSSGTSLLIASGNEVRHLPITLKKEEAETVFQGSKSGVGIRAIVNKSGTRALISEFDMAASKNTWNLLDLSNFKPIKSFVAKRLGDGPSPVFSPSGEQFLAVSDEGLALYESSSGEISKELN